MKINPLKRYKTPEYPIHEILKAHPELLRFVPKRWTNAPLVISALSLACLILAARDGWTADEKASPAIRNGTTAGQVAPIFHHGAGRGSFGCMSTASPVFLTEDEARQVINEEAAKTGIHFENTTAVIAGVETPITDRYQELTNDIRTKKPKTVKSSLMLDGKDSEKKISYEYVSREDYEKMEIKERVMWCSVSSYGIVPAAEILREGLTKAATGQTLAVFYDPVSMYGYSSEDEKLRARSAKQMSLNELRKQVQDFIVWLKAQGII
jgi:hypothetical protein